MKVIKLHGKKAAGRVAKVSDTKYSLVMAYRWHIWEQQRPNGTFSGPYAVTNLPRIRVNCKSVSPQIKMHELIMGCKGVDHRNGNGLDNQDANLRKATSAQNNQNQGPRPGTSIYKGVSWDRVNQKWKAEIRAEGKRHWLGRFSIEADAAHVVDTAAIKWHGEFARLNFPGEHVA